MTVVPPETKGLRARVPLYVRVSILMIMGGMLFG